jgi:RND family efflux transporter MFP subunit
MAESLSPRLRRRLLGFASGFAILAVSVWLVLVLSGFLREEPPATEHPARVLPSAEGLPVAVVREERVPEIEEAVGAIRAVQEIAISPRILARIEAMNVRAAGQQVQAGEVLVELEKTDLEARLRNAEAALRAAEETRDQAARELERTRELHAQQIRSERDLERDGTAFENAEAAVERGRQVIRDAEVTLEFATIRSPIDGIVIDKLREQGDTVAPGQILLTIYDPSRMQLVASVREGLATSLAVGGEVMVQVDALGLRCHGTVSEIVPQAEAQSRAFDVKVTGPCPDGVFSGMFGRLLLEAGTRLELRVPTTAVARVGQVELVHAITQHDEVLRRFVVVGERRGDEVVILSGLSAGDRIVADVAALDRRERPAVVPSTNAPAHGGGHR